MTKEQLITLYNFLYRVTHWKEGTPDLHDMKVMVRTAMANSHLATEEQGLVTEVLVLRAKLRDLAVEHVELQRLLKNTTYKADHWFEVALANNLVDDGA